MTDEPAEFQWYPSHAEVDEWIDALWASAEASSCEVQRLDEQGYTHSFGVRHMPDHRYVEFCADGTDPFYGYWQPAPGGPSPLLVHVPGYGAEMSMHPDLVAEGYNVLHISPLGYSTPTGSDESKMRDGRWPVLPDTLLTGAEGGYREWLKQCLLAVRWAASQPEVIENRVSFFGTSQGGGGALLLGSLFRDRGCRCVAADVAFLTGFPLGKGKGAYAETVEGMAGMTDLKAGWRTLGFIDTFSHARRLTCPVLLTAAGDDETCPPETIAALFERLPSTRSYTYLAGVGHRYTVEFIPLARAWFRLYA